MKNLVVLYAYPEALPSNKARAIQVINTCHRLSSFVARLYLCVEESSCDAQQIFRHYGLTKPANLEILFFPRHFALLNSIRIFSWKLKRALPALEPGVIITRHISLVSLLKSSGIPVIFEAHQIMAEKSRVNFHTVYAEKQAFLQADGIAFLSGNLLAQVKSQIDLRAPHAVIPSGTDVSDVDTRKTRLPASHFVYAGSTHYAWKGLETLLQALQKLEQGTLHMIGKLDPPWNEEHPLLKTLITGGKAKIYGYLPHEQVRQKLQEFQIAVLPNSATDANSRLYTSPLKLLEYMAARTAIVASDLPSIRELVSENEVLFVEPDNADALATGLQTLLGQENVRNNLAENACKRVQNYSWDQRASKFLALMETVVSRSR